jgi:hypothetical protein
VEARDRVLDLLLVELGDDYEHDFVDVQVFASSGLESASPRWRSRGL